MYIFIGLGKPISGDEKICDKIMLLNIRHFLLNPLISSLHVQKLVYRYGNSSHEKCAKNQNLGAGKGPEFRQPLVKKI
jgi:hypothetical protein